MTAVALMMISGSAFAEKLVIKVGHGHTATHSYQLGLEQSAKMIADKTDGRIQLKFFPSAQL